MDIVMTTRMVLNVPAMLVRNEAMAEIGWSILCQKIISVEGSSFNLLFEPDDLTVGHMKENQENFLNSTLYIIETQITTLPQYLDA